MANERTYIRFPAIDIEQNATINSALVRFTAYEYKSGNLNVDCYFENSINTSAPSDKSELTSLPLTGGTTWNITEAWVDGEIYNSPDVGDILQVIISKDVWVSGNAVTFIMDIAGETEYRKFCAEEYSGGLYKAQLIIESNPPTKVATPIISPITGTYIGTQTITITCVTPDSSIYYTTDESTPDNTDNLYTSSFPVTAGDTTVKAIGYSNEPGYTASLVRINIYEVVLPCLLFHADGLDGSTNFVDSSTYNHSMNGTVTTIISDDTHVPDFTGDFGLVSLKSSKTGYIIIPNNDIFNFKGSDFTIDLWSKSWFSDDPLLLYKTGTKAWLFELHEDNPDWHVSFSYSFNGSDWITMESPEDSVSVGDWQHFAVCRVGSFIYLFINGIIQDTHDVGVNRINSSTGALYICGSGTSKMYYDEVRIINGVGAWSENFTPPTEPYT